MIKRKHWILLLALLLGFGLGFLFHPWAGTPFFSMLNQWVLVPIGQIFLRLIFMVVVPLVFSALILGVYELAKSDSMGRVALKTLGYTLITSTLSVVIGLAVVNVFKPGASLSQDSALKSSMVQTQLGAVQKIEKQVEVTKPVSQIIVELIPKNPFEAAVKAFDGEMIALMVFALILGIALSQVARENPEYNPFIGFLEQLMNASMRIVTWAMQLAPLAIFSLVFQTTLKLGPEVFVSVFFYVVCVLLGLALQQFGVYSILLAAIAKRSPWHFFKTCREVMLYAFSTASSNATLPEALKVAEQGLKLNPNRSRFVLTVGSTANQNGTALFEGITVLFLAQVYQIDLSLAQQAQVVALSILAGVGTAGVPGGSLPLILLLLQSVGIPAEGMGLVLGVDRFLDMCRTTVNVTGDLVIAALVDSDGTRPS